MTGDNNKNNESQLQRLADFLHEVGMLKNIPRSGFAFLGSGKESIAEHSYRTSVIGFVLAQLTGANAAIVTFLCLFHDLHEARTGDFNYVNHRYDSCNAEQALKDATTGTGLENIILGFWNQLEAKDSLESLLAHDADQLDLVCTLQAELCKGNKFADEWLESAVKRLKTEAGQQLATAILQSDPNNWWYGQIDKSWWINHGAR